MAALIKSIVEKWVALYVRLSRDDENEGDSNSIAHQIEILTRYAKEHGITNYKIYKDDGYSGTNFKRPGLMTAWTATTSRTMISPHSAIL